MKYRYVPSTLEGLNDLTGGIPTGTIIGLYGAARGGKTTLSFHLVFDKLMEEGSDENALIFDTEGSEYTYIEWLEILNKRYEVNFGLKWVNYDQNTLKTSITDDGKEHDKYIYVLDVRTVEHILAFHGRGCTISISKTRSTRDGEVKGGKITLKPEAQQWMSIWNSPLGKFVIEHDIGMVVYDSITNPLAIFGSQEENLPARSNCTSWWLTRAQELAEVHELAMIAVIHETSNPQRSWERPGYEGGKSVEHNLKFIIYINEGKSKRTPATPNKDKEWYSTTREIRNARHPCKKPFNDYIKLDLTDEGFVDME